MLFTGSRRPLRLRSPFQLSHGRIVSASERKQCFRQLCSRQCRSRRVNKSEIPIEKCIADGRTYRWMLWHSVRRSGAVRPRSHRTKLPLRRCSVPVCVERASREHRGRVWCVSCRDLVCVWFGRAGKWCDNSLSQSQKSTNQK